MSSTNAAPAYPDDMHPGLVPGISVEEQRNRFGVDKLVFGVTAVLIVAFIIWGIAAPDTVGEVAGNALNWGMYNFGWLFNIIMSGCVVLMLVIAFSRFGTIKLGKDDEEPEYSFFSWIAMMFAAGIGVGIFFFGPSEPLNHYITPPPLTVDAETPEALHQAMAQSHFHWGVSPWSAYALVGGALAYSTYRRGRVSLMSSIFTPLTKGGAAWTGKIVDILAIVATLFGTAASLGVASLQITEGVSIVGGIEVSTGVLIAIVMLLSTGFMISAVSGVSKGVRILSNINITLTLGAIFFVFVTGPTLFLTNLIPSGTIAYVDKYMDMASRSLTWGTETLDFQSAWTAFYWAWWIAWTPFVGMFIARISRGRTLRQFVIVTIVVPTTVLILAFTIFGGTTISFNRDNIPGFDGTSSTESVLYAMFEQLPFYGLTSALLIVILSIFFITSADSASVVMGTMSSKGDPAPKKPIVLFWGACMMGIAVVMLLTGGEDALSGLQSLTILSALPFSVILIFIGIAFLRDLSTDPLAIRNTYARSAMRAAVIKGLEEYGDDFELTVNQADEGKGAGADFDSTAAHVTDWYQRTNEDGENVGYDYETGTWADGYEAEDSDSESESESGSGSKKD